MPSKCYIPLVSGECPGHLGKFDHCHAEAVYELSLDDPRQGCGDGDWHGYLSLVIVDDTENVTIEDGSGRVVAVERGDYLVFTAPTGGVTVSRGADSRERYDDWERDYWAWDNQDEDA